MKFKIGDKVKRCNPPMTDWIGNNIGTVERLNGGMYPVFVKWDIAFCIVCGEESCGCKIIARWYKLSDIGHVATKNQQLVFNFMNKE